MSPTLLSRKFFLAEKIQIHSHTLKSQLGIHFHGILESNVFSQEQKKVFKVGNTACNSIIVVC